MFDKINILKQKGYYPDTILDIGAHHGNWTNSMRKIFEYSKYYLFEAIDYPQLNQFNNNNSIKAFNILLNDKIEQVNWYQMKNTGDSMFKEKTRHFNNCEIIKRETIDLNTFIAEANILQEQGLISFVKSFKTDVYKNYTELVENIESFQNEDKEQWKERLKKCMKMWDEGTIHAQLVWHIYEIEIHRILPEN